LAASLNTFLAHLRGVLDRRDAGEQSDGLLLELFLSQRDESAFAALMHRHGPMVLGVCRRILGGSHDVEDAFQATFLVLVRRGDSIRPRDQVGNWLYGVACRTALEARRAAAKRRLKERHVVPRTHPEEDIWSELRPVLDRELVRLPDKYRIPLVLCDLEGVTRKEAAHQLGWAEGTVSSRLSRARELLGRRMKRHGLALSGVALAEGMAPAALPVSLVVSTVKAVLLTASGQTAAASLFAANAVALTERMVRIMWIVKLKFVAAIVLGVGIMGVAAYHGLARQPSNEKQSIPAKPPAQAVGKGEGAGEKNAVAEDEKKPTVSVKEMPPVVVQTFPQAGDTNVDADKVKEIRVTFSKDMRDKSWSWSQISDETFPKTTGKAHYDKDRRTCVLPVKLEAGKTYVFWLNSLKFGNFKDASGQSAVPYLLVFETKADR
jgi:RNA polymerase sigma factor (sigma-70 family)